MAKVDNKERARKLTRRIAEQIKRSAGKGLQAAASGLPQETHSLVEADFPQTGA